MPADAGAAFLSASEASAAMRAGRLSVEDLARACLARIEERDASVRAWAFVDRDLVLAEARELDRRGPSGPLHGLPIGVKDVILTRDMPTQYNSPIYRGFHPAMDAVCVRALRAAGALILGKTDTVEFAASGRRALSRNPHDLARTPGGSSSGSGAAVADFHVPLALGTQTGGSTIRPASFCGVFAIKPSWGVVSFEGTKTYSPTLDTIGWYGRSAADLALLYDVFDPPDPAEPVPPEPAVTGALEGARIAVCRSPAWHLASPDTLDALAAAAAALAAQGARVVDLALPDDFAALLTQSSLIMRAEGRAAFRGEYAAAYDQLHESFRAQVENRDGTSRGELRAAYDNAARCRAQFDGIAAGYDAVLTPSAVGEATPGLASTGDAVFNRMWTLLHVPCVNVPGLRGRSGLPVGVTLTRERFADRALLRLATQVGAILGPAGDR